MIIYNKLFNLLASKGYSGRYWLQCQGIHPNTISKLQKNQRINTDTLDKLCQILDCQPGDLLEYVPDDSASNTDNPSPANNPQSASNP